MREEGINKPLSEAEEKKKIAHENQIRAKMYGKL